MARRTSAFSKTKQLRRALPPDQPRPQPPAPTASSIAGSTASVRSVGDRLGFGRFLRQESPFDRPQTLEERLSLPRRLHAMPLEVVGDAHVGVEPGRVLVKVQEGTRPVVEDASTPFDQTRYESNLLEHRF